MKKYLLTIVILEKSKTPIFNIFYYFSLVACNGRGRTMRSLRVC